MANRNLTGRDSQRVRSFAAPIVRRATVALDLPESSGRFGQHKDATSIIAFDLLDSAFFGTHTTVLSPRQAA